MKKFFARARAVLEDKGGEGYVDVTPAVLSFQRVRPTAHTRIRRGSIIPQVSTSDTRTVITVTFLKHSIKVTRLKPSLSSTPHLSISITLIAPSATVWLATQVPKHIPLPLPRVTEISSIRVPSADIPIL